MSSPPMRRMSPEQALQAVVPLRALRNPTPVRDLARGIAFEALPVLHQMIHDGDLRADYRIKAFEAVSRISMGSPSPVDRKGGEEEADAEARTLQFLKQALQDPGMRALVLEKYPGLLKSAEESVPESVVVGEAE